MEKIYLKILCYLKLIINLKKERLLLLKDNKLKQIFNLLDKSKSNDSLRKINNHIFKAINVSSNKKNKIKKLFNLNYKITELSYFSRPTINDSIFLEKNYEKGELLEKYCWSGHNTYPFPKLIIGTNKNEILKINKKILQDFYIGIINKDLVSFSSIIFKDYENFLKLKLPIFWNVFKSEINKKRETIIPIHFLQLTHDFYIRRLVLAKKIIIRKIRYHYQLLTSIRSLLLIDDKVVLKLPINIKITSEKRLIFQSFSHNAPIFSHIIKDLISKDKLLLKSLYLVEDFCSIRLSNYWGAKHLSCIFRNSTLNLLNKKIYPANFLFEITDIFDNKRVLDYFFSNTISKNKLNSFKFFKQYIYKVVSAPLILYIKYGIGVEPHLQNSFISLDKNFLPERLILRDIDGVNINTRILSKYIDLSKLKFHRLTPFMFKNDDFSIIRLYHSLIYNHIRELVLFYKKKFNYREKDLWIEVRNIIDKIVKKIKTEIINDPEIKERLNYFNKKFFSSKIETKALLTMKILETEFFKTTMIKNYLFIK